jgi:hypothetical protein
VKITLDREEVQRILVEYMNSLMPNGKFNACELKCSSYAYFQSADIYHEEKPE